MQGRVQGQMRDKAEGMVSNETYDDTHGGKKKEDKKKGMRRRRASPCQLVIMH